MAGDMQGALDAQYRLAPMRMAYNLSSFPVVTKDYMRLLGFDMGEPIKPNTRSKPEVLDYFCKNIWILWAQRNWSDH